MQNVRPENISVKTYPLKPHFYIEKQGFVGVYKYLISKREPKTYMNIVGTRKNCLFFFFFFFFFLIFNAEKSPMFYVSHGCVFVMAAKLSTDTTIFRHFYYFSSMDKQSVITLRKHAHAIYRDF